MNRVVNPIVYRRLVKAAKARTTVTFAELGEAADLAIEEVDERKILELILDHIADQEAAEGRPLLSVLAVDSATGALGGGLLRYARRKNFPIAGDAAFFAEETQHVYAYWAKATPPTG